MKTLSLTVILLITSTLAYGQVMFSVTAPASIAGGYNFTSNGDGTNWGLPNLLDPMDAVLDTCVLAEDGTVGINAQGIPLSNEACGPIINNVNNKIAVLYRYDGVTVSNVCWYGTKVLNAENAGARAVIMINRDDALIDVPGTDDGPLTSIPFAFISKSDGAILREKIENGEDVVAFIGSKLGLYNNDLTITRSTSLVPSISSTPALTAQDATEFGFDVGTNIYNWGSNDQTNVMVTATVTGPGAPWTETVGPFTIPAGDSLDVVTNGPNNIPAFSLAAYPEGRYTLSYSVDLGVADESDFDNTLEHDFLVSDSIISYATMDITTDLPSGITVASPTGQAFSSCIAYSDANASRLAVDGMYFSCEIQWDLTSSLDGEEMGITLYEWNDAFTDLNDPNFGFTSMNPVAWGFYYYPGDLQGELVYGEFDTPYQLIDDQRYVACVETFNPEIWMGFDTGVDYTRNVNHYLQAQSPIMSDAGYFALGFGADRTSSASLGFFDASLLSVDDKMDLKGSLYPNPANDIVTISIPTINKGTASIIDLTGRVMSTVKLSGPVTNLDIVDLTTGTYMVNIVSEGAKTQFKFVKR